MSRTAMNSQQMALRDAYGDIGYEQAQEVHQVITGTPDTIIAKLQKGDRRGESCLAGLWARGGTDVACRSDALLELLGKEVIPAMKAYQPNVEGDEGP